MKNVWKKERYSTLDRECAAYLGEYPVFEPLLRGFREKYASYGMFSGSVTLRNLGKCDIEVLEGFFQKNFHGNRTITISAARFEKALKESRFEGAEPKSVLELYFREEVTGKKEEIRQKQQKWELVFEELEQGCEDTLALIWLADIRSTKEGMYSYYRKIYGESDGDAEELKRELMQGLRIVNSLPYRHAETEYLAVFAANITGNPHAFDDRIKGGQLLYMLVQWCAKQRGISIRKSDIFPALQKQQLYLHAGILRDDISNYVMISGVRAWKKDGRLHSGMEGFLNEGDMVQVPLSVLVGWQRVECPGQEIYIVENPSVYAMLSRRWNGKRACMCMNGQPRLSAVLLLELLAETGTFIHYAGDFDPEGLLIAQKLKQYYTGSFSYWHMSAKEYEKSKSGKQISKRRMQILQKVTDMELMETVAAVKADGVAGYQENILGSY